MLQDVDKNGFYVLTCKCGNTETLEEGHNGWQKFTFHFEHRGLNIKTTVTCKKCSHTYPLEETRASIAKARGN